jgi:hypothetical protein
MMIIAQVTMVGMLALKKAGTASAMMFPLLIITILFSVYINQQHFKTTEHLSARDCMAVDLKNNAECEMDYSFLRGQYVQPELQEREILPENYTVDREIAAGCVKYVTPPNSANGDI